MCLVAYAVQYPTEVLMDRFYFVVVQFISNLSLIIGSRPNMCGYSYEGTSQKSREKKKKSKMRRKYWGKEIEIIVRQKR